MNKLELHKLFKKGLFAKIRDEFWKIQVSGEVYPGIDPEMKDNASKTYEIVSIEEHTQNVLLKDGYWYCYSWLIPISDEDTLFEMYVNNQIDGNEYEETKEVIESA